MSTETNATVVGIILGRIGFFFFQSWMVMLLLGGVHHSLWDKVPALGFPQTVLAMVVLNVLLALLGIRRRAS